MDSTSPRIGAWHSMKAHAEDLLERRTGDDVKVWLGRVREAGVTANEPKLRHWLGEQGVSGYGQDVVAWEIFGYPDFLTASADELIDGQYADRQHLRPIADAVFLAAAELDGVRLEARKTFVSVIGPRRKIALVQPTTKKLVDVGFRVDHPVAGRLEEAKSLGDDRMDRRIRLADVSEVDDEVRRFLALALEQSR